MHASATNQVNDRHREYIESAWRQFSREPARAEVTRDAVRGVPIRRVLDLGCGAGQELRPLFTDAQAFGVGLDISFHAAISGRAFFAMDQATSHVAFVCGAAERLPFASAAFDVVICRLALPYTDNRDALAEIARVMRPGGILLLSFHHVRYYGRKLRRALTALDGRQALYACRVLLAGCLYHLTGVSLDPDRSDRRRFKRCGCCEESCGAKDS